MFALIPRLMDDVFVLALVVTVVGLLWQRQWAMAALAIGAVLTVEPSAQYWPLSAARQHPTTTTTTHYEGESYTCYWETLHIEGVCTPEEATALMASSHQSRRQLEDTAELQLQAMYPDTYYAGATMGWCKYPDGEIHRCTGDMKPLTGGDHE